jgi:CHAD domain-containing protein
MTKRGKRSTGARGATVDPQQPYDAAMTTLIGERWGTVWRTIPEAMSGADIEGVHDVRVASRRLRAAMDVAVDAFPATWYRPLHATAKEITSALGEVRDRDVLIEFLAEEHLRAPREEWPGLDRLIERVETEQATARATMERFLATLLANDTPAETVRRFGPAAALPDTASALPEAGHKEGR